MPIRMCVLTRVICPSRSKILYEFVTYFIKQDKEENYNVKMHHFINR